METANESNDRATAKSTIKIESMGLKNKGAKLWPYF